MRLASISANGFKTISNLKGLKLEQINVLTGPNGAGKSNLIDFLDLMGQTARTTGGIINYRPPKGVRAFPTTGDEDQGQEPITVRLTFEHGGQETDYSVTLHAWHASRLAVTKEMAGSPGEPSKAKRVLSPGEHPSGLKLLDTSQEAGLPEIRQHLMAIRTIRPPFGARTTRPGEEQDPMAYCSAMAQFLLQLRSRRPNIYRFVQNMTRRALPHIHSIAIKQVNNKPSIHFIEKDTYESYTAEQVSPGTMNTLALITGIYQPTTPKDTLVLLDDPDTGLSPQAGKEVAKLLQLASKKAQVVIATHSPSFLGSFEAKDTVHVSKFMNRSTFQHLPQDGTQAPDKPCWL